MGRFAFIFLLCAGALAFGSERYALLVGISHYVPGQRLPDLDGPLHDVDAMAKALQTLDYKPANVIILRDAQASKAGILAAFDSVIARARPGDYFFFYYSGHGTSPQDANSKDLPIDVDSGALYPADFRLGTPAQINDRLVVGRRDLRPRLEKLDGKVTVFGLLDTCFSANLMKGLHARGKPKSVPLWQLTPKSTTRSMEGAIAQDLEDYEQAAAKQEPFPYRTIAWISAALAGQQAMDIDDPALTMDGQPHGALTNAFLKGLAGGAADRNRDGNVTHAEMYDFLLQESRDWSHQPAWVANDGNQAISRMSLLASGKALSGTASRAHFNGTVRVSLDAGAAALRPRLANVRGIEIGADHPDLVVRAEGGGFLVSQAGGVPLIDKPVEADVAVARISSEPEVRRLIDWHYDRPRAAVDLSLSIGGKPWRLGFLRPTHGAGDPNIVSAVLKTDAGGDARQIWPLIVDVDVTGLVTLLYPHPGATAPLPRGQEQNLGANEVSCTCGIEYIKAFVFDREPPDWESWAAQKAFYPSDPAMRRLLDTVAGGAGETTMRVITNDRY